jgi:small GTP-binding protein
MEPRKVIFIGSANVGKTTLAMRLAGNTFCEQPASTIGIDLLTTTIDVDGVPQEVQFWDTAGSERFRSLVPNYLRKGNIVLMCYDSSSEESYDDLISFWAQLVLDVVPGKPRILVALKSDLGDAVSVQRASEWAGENNIPFLVTSAKTGTGCDELKRLIGQMEIENEDLKRVITEATPESYLTLCC